MATGTRMGGWGHPTEPHGGYSGAQVSNYSPLAPVAGHPITAETRLPVVIDETGWVRVHSSASQTERAVLGAGSGAFPDRIEIRPQLARAAGAVEPGLAF